MIREEVLFAAKKLITKDRAEQYGSAEESFQRIASYWSVYLNTEIAPSDVANMMALLKMSRMSTTPDHRDSYVDLAGYVALSAELNLKQDEPSDE